MSAIAAMLAGCVVLSGNEPETRLTIGTNEIPVVSACPDSNQLYTELEKLILHPEEIERIGKQSVVYARQYHDCKFVAQRYLDVFQNN